MPEHVVPVGGSPVSLAVFGEGRTAVVLGHGAGGNRQTPLLLALAERIAASGRRAVLYNFPYAEARSRRPDPPARLEAATRAVGSFARASLGAARLVHGGKSMGGRIASQVVAAGEAADGLVFLGYPLHSPGRPDKLRDAHLPAVEVPMLFLQGTRDDFARWDLIEDLARRLAAPATLHRLEGADHSFRVPAKSGRTDDDVRAELEGALFGWLERLGL
jgi:hypothetical protein